MIATFLFVSETASFYGALADPVLCKPDWPLPRSTEIRGIATMPGSTFYLRQDLLLSSELTDLPASALSFYSSLLFPILSVRRPEGGEDAWIEQEDVICIHLR